MVDHASPGSSKSKVQFDSHADVCILGETVKSFMTIIEHLMSTVTIEKMAIEVPR